MASGVVMSIHQLLIVVPGCAKEGWARLYFNAQLQAKQGLLVLKPAGTQMLTHFDAGGGPSVTCHDTGTVWLQMCDGAAVHIEEACMLRT